VKEKWVECYMMHFERTVEVKRAKELKSEYARKKIPRIKSSLNSLDSGTET
jgi:hypothetical protein